MGSDVNFLPILNETFSFLGGFYSDSVATVAEECLRCNLGTYVPPENAPGKKVLDCEVCPTGEVILD